jgi:DNA-binding Xre family transcriptional regulator
MQVVYDKLFDKLKAEGIQQKTLREELSFSNSVFNRFRHNEPVTTETIGKICEYLNCTPNDIMEIKFDNELVQLYEAKRKEKAEIEKQIAELQAKLKS